MFSKDIKEDFSKIDKNLNLGLSLFVIVASFLGIFMMGNNKQAVTSLAILESSSIKPLGSIFLIVLIFAILIALVNLGISLNKKY